MPGDLAERLQGLGFSAYEAKAYLALLRKNPVTGYELSRLSGVPSAKIYETVDRLKERGAVTMVFGTPQLYAPVPPAELLRELRRQFETTVSGLEESLARAAVETESEYIWNLRDYQRILAAAAGLIDAAAREVAAFVWAQEAAALADRFEAAIRRGVRLLGVVCGPLAGLAELVRHGFEQEVLEEHGEKLFVIVRDAEEAILGGLGAAAGAAMTRHFGLVRVGLEYVKHEMYQAKIMKHYGRRFIEDFGPHLERLRPGRKDG